MAKKTESLSLEDALLELEQIVEKMETGNLTLDESLQSFERGVFLTRYTQDLLQKAEQKVQILLSNNGEVAEKPFIAENTQLKPQE